MPHDKAMKTSISSPSTSSETCRPALRTAPPIAAGLTAATLLLTGCASVGEVEPHTNALDPAVVGLSEGSASPAVEAGWWEAFKEPALDELVRKALADHPSLQAAAARVEGARAQSAGARANTRPQLNGTLDVTRERFSDGGLEPPTLAGTTATTGTLQLDASWEVDFFGRNRAALQAALGTERAAVAEAEAARTVLASSVARSYFELARLQAQREVAERTLAQRTNILELIRQRVRSGLDTNVELRQGEGSLPEIRQQLEALDEQMAATRHALAALTVQPPNALDALTPHLRVVQAMPLPAELPVDLLARRADVEAARDRVEAAMQDLKAARAEFFPSVNLAAFAGFGAIGLENLVEAGSRQYGVGPALHLPIFDAGRLRANYKGRAADVDAAISAYNAAVLDAVREVADQISALSSIDRQQREQVAAQRAAESAFELATQRYEAGLATYLTVLSAETNVLAQRRSGADLQARSLDAQVALIRALGGGYTAPTEAEHSR